MKKGFNIFLHKNFLVSILISLLLWFAILLFGVWDTPKNMYFNVIPENTYAYLNVDLKDENQIDKKYFEILNTYFNTDIQSDLENIFQYYKNNFVMSFYKDGSGVDQMVIIGESSKDIDFELTFFKFGKYENTLQYFSTDNTFSISKQNIRLNEWQRKIQRYGNESMSVYISEDIHGYTDLDDIVGTFNFINGFIKYEFEKVNGENFAQKKFVSIKEIPKNYTYSLYLDNLPDFNRLFAQLDQSIYEIIGNYFVQKDVNFVVSFNDIENPSQFTIQIIPSSQKKFYEGFVNYIAENLAYLHPVKKEFLLGDGTQVYESVADISEHIITQTIDTVLYGNNDAYSDFIVRNADGYIEISSGKEFENLEEVLDFEPVAQNFVVCDITKDINGFIIKRMQSPEEKSDDEDNVSSIEMFEDSVDDKSNIIETDSSIKENESYENRIIKNISLSVTNNETFIEGCFNYQNK